MSSANPWPPGKIEKFRQLWLSGWSGGEIAQLLGVTRAAVMGKIYRLGIGRSAAPGKISERMRGNTNSKGKTYVRRPTGQYRRRQLLDPPPETHITPLRNIGADQCRYIAGAPAGRETLMCGHEILFGPYCGYHHRLCHTKAAHLPPRGVVGAPTHHPPVRVGAPTIQE